MRDLQIRGQCYIGGYVEYSPAVSRRSSLDTYRPDPTLNARPVRICIWHAAQILSFMIQNVSLRFHSNSRAACLSVPLRELVPIARTCYFYVYDLMLMLCIVNVDALMDFLSMH